MNKSTGAFHSHGDIPTAAWLLKENPNLKWMITKGAPYFRKPPYHAGWWFGAPVYDSLAR